MRNCLACVGVASLAAAVALAQGPEPSRGTASVTLEGKTISVDYGRPSVQGRTVEALLQKLPADRMWRAGANEVTTFTTEMDLMLGDTRVPAGKYSMYVHCPETGEYSLTLNKALGQPLGSIWKEAPAELKDKPYPHFKYTEQIGDQEVARVPMKRIATTQPADLFTVQLERSEAGALMTLWWGDQGWAIPLRLAK